MEAAFVAKIRASCHSPETDSPELQFLGVYDERSPPSPDTVKSRFKSCLNKVEYHINTPRGLADYMKLAESRHRIYRPLLLDKFRLTRPYTLRLSPTWPLVEMTKHATPAHFKLRNAISQNIYGLPKFIASTSDEFQARSKILPDANENSLGTFLVPPVESSNDCGPSTTNEGSCAILSPAQRLSIGILRSTDDKTYLGTSATGIIDLLIQVMRQSRIV
ncbi:hypothetical protein BDV32DRAFT_155507 [Aspergillus pseudonomiae]|nr:hypothetical protein BDV32DRAFT_155507 [Aspergillus pseudonomiae]